MTIEDILNKFAGWNYSLSQLKRGDVTRFQISIWQDNIQFQSEADAPETALYNIFTQAATMASALLTFTDVIASLE